MGLPAGNPLKECPHRPLGAPPPNARISYWSVVAMDVHLGEARLREMCEGGQAASVVDEIGASDAPREIGAIIRSR